MSHLMNIQPLVTFTVILRPPVSEAGRSRRWSAHCLDLDMAVSAQSASMVRQRLASTIAAHIALGGYMPPRRALVQPELWDVAGAAPLVTRQTVETDHGPVEVRYVQPHDAMA